MVNLAMSAFHLIKKCITDDGIDKSRKIPYPSWSNGSLSFLEELMFGTAHSVHYAFGSTAINVSVSTVDKYLISVVRALSSRKDYKYLYPCSRCQFLEQQDDV